MPKLRHYTITQVREVRISATNTTDAAALAHRVLSGTKHSADQLNVRSEILERELNIREDD